MTAATNNRDMRDMRSAPDMGNGCADIERPLEQAANWNAPAVVLVVRVHVEVVAVEHVVEREEVHEHVVGTEPLHTRDGDVELHGWRHALRIRRAERWTPDSGLRRFRRRTGDGRVGLAGVVA